MDINGVFYSGTNSVNSLKEQEAVEKFKKTEAAKTEDTSAKENTVADSYEKSDEMVSSESGIYSKENIAKSIKEIEAQRQQAMTNMLTEMLGKQAQAAGFNFFTGQTQTVTLNDIEEAKSSISEGGYWSVDSVAGRIMDMAKALAGGDASKFETLKNAVIEGFGGAAKQLGFKSMDDMPEITSQTFNEVMNRFDKWGEELGISSNKTEQTE